jgi:hypothetical protein
MVIMIEQRLNKEFWFVITVILGGQSGNLAIYNCNIVNVGKMEAHNDIDYTARELAGLGVSRRLDCTHACSKLVPRSMSNLAFGVSSTALIPGQSVAITPSHVEPRLILLSCLRFCIPILRIPEGHHQEVAINPLAALGSFPSLSFVSQFDYHVPAFRILAVIPGACCPYVRAADRQPERRK